MKPTRGRVPLFGIVSRLATQKGLRPAHRHAARNCCRTTICGSLLWAPGEARYENSSPASPKSIAAVPWFFGGYDDSLAHWIEGASDIF
jgi:glycogen synthase